MKKFKLFVLSLCAGLVMVSCTNAAKGAGIGAGGGALVGAIIGKMAGNTAVGAVIGTAVGTTTGALIGKHMDKVKAQAQAVQNAQVESITDAHGLQGVKVFALSVCQCAEAECRLRCGHLWSYRQYGY